MKYNFGENQYPHCAAFNDSVEEVTTLIQEKVGLPVEDVNRFLAPSEWLYVLEGKQLDESFRKEIATKVKEIKTRSNLQQATDPKGFKKNLDEFLVFIDG